MSESISVTHAEPRAEALVTFSDNTILSAPVGTSLEQYVSVWHAEKAAIARWLLWSMASCAS
jgi:hypothetical protein